MRQFVMQPQGWCRRYSPTVWQLEAGCGSRAPTGQGDSPILPYSPPHPARTGTARSRAASGRRPRLEQN